MIANSEDISPVVAIHAGAGFVPREALYLEYIQDVYIGLNASLDAAYDILKDGGSSLDAVQAAVVVLEECPRFNAGRGSVMTADGTHELDASIMEGKDRRVGAVIGIKTVRNPIKLARAVMEKTEHVTLATIGAEKFADSLGDQIERVPNSFFTTPSRAKALHVAQEKEKEKEKVINDKNTTSIVGVDDHSTVINAPVLVNVEHALESSVKDNLIELDRDLHTTDDILNDKSDDAHDTKKSSNTDEDIDKLCTIESQKTLGTVGAVALDSQGVLSAATSTGGMTNKKYGRVGDSPIIGCGTWADDTVAVSCTGWGEFFIRNVTAYDISARMRYSKVNLSEAANTAIHDVLGSHGGDGGVICVDKDGNISLPFNSGCMFRGWINKDGSRGVAIYEEELADPFTNH